jgi:hypothetical protein
MTFISMNRVRNEDRATVIDEIFKEINKIAGDLCSSDLDWAIKMEDSYNEYGNLTDKQLLTLINILKKYHGRDTD